MGQHIKGHPISPPMEPLPYMQHYSYGGVPYVPYGGGPTITGLDSQPPPMSYSSAIPHQQQMPHSLPLTDAPMIGIPALDFNGYVLYASVAPIPDELVRNSTGDSIAEPGSILDEESGRTYANHETGRYFLPNDPVCTWILSYHLTISHEKEELMIWFFFIFFSSSYLNYEKKKSLVTQVKITIEPSLNYICIYI